MNTNTIANLLDTLERDWSTPRRAQHRGKPTPFALSCSIELHSAPLDFDVRAPGNLEDVRAPGDLEDFWQHATSARLFEDTEYGQWGLALLSPSDALARTHAFEEERSSDYKIGDLIIGEFLGDAELLLLRCDPENADFGRVLVALPIDPRQDWPDVATSLSHFIEKYTIAQGDKFWNKYQ